MDSSKWWEEALGLVSQMCADGSAVLVPAAGGGPASWQERHLLYFGAVVCRLRVSDAGVEMSWLAGPPDEASKVTHREVYAWESVATQVRHHEDWERRSVPNQWDVLARVAYLSARATPDPVRREYLAVAQGPEVPVRRIEDDGHGMREEDS